MSDCPYYQIHTRNIQSREINGPGNSAKVVTPYCTHENSPAKFQHVTIALGGSTVLTCGGDLDKCQIK